MVVVLGYFIALGGIIIGFTGVFWLIKGAFGNGMSPLNRKQSAIALGFALLVAGEGFMQVANWVMDQTEVHRKAED